MMFKNVSLILFTEFLYLHPQVEGMAHTFQGFFSLSGEKAEAMIREEKKPALTLQKNSM